MSTLLPRRRLGATGPRVSVLGLGTVKFGRKEQVDYPALFELPDDRAAARLLDVARELGVNLLDTAPAYGSAETRLGRLLRGRRDDFVLVTKCGEVFEHGASRFDFGAEHTRASVHRSLRRLRTDHLDCVLVHSDGDDLALVEDGAAFDALARLKAQGHIGAFGLSSKTVAGGLAALPHVDVVMITLSQRHAADAEVARAAEAAGRGVLVKKALDRGHVQGDPADALRWSASRPGVSSVVVGSIDEAHLRQNAGALTDTAAADLDARDAGAT